MGRYKINFMGHSAAQPLYEPRHFCIDLARRGAERFGKPMKFTPKYGRKAFSSYQWINGTPLELIKKMMGHSPSSRVTVDHYIHMPDEAMKDRVIEMPL